MNTHIVWKEGYQHTTGCSQFVTILISLSIVILSLFPEENIGAFLANLGIRNEIYNCNAVKMVIDVARKIHLVN
jgi:hypothetical protein